MDEIDRCEEIITIGQKTIGWGVGENGPFVIVLDGETQTYKANPFTRRGARRLFNKIKEMEQRKGT
jgi:hypothetical protein